MSESGNGGGILIEGDDDLITVYGGDEPDRVMGYLMHFPGRGVYESELGLVDISPERAERHNKALSAAEIEGMHKNCEVGMGGSFYWYQDEDMDRVKTWIGEIVSDRVVVTNTKRRRYISFSVVNRYTGVEMVFKGTIKDDNECFVFTRIK